MTFEEKKVFLDGYQKAMKDALDDLASIHASHPSQLAVRKVVDMVWAKIKERLKRSKDASSDFYPK